MRCPVCSASWQDGQYGQGARCPQCGQDANADELRDPSQLAAARRAFRERTTAYAPHTRVGLRDKALPWLGAALGFALFVLWLRACGSGGFRF